MSTVSYYWTWSQSLDTVKMRNLCDQMTSHIFELVTMVAEINKTKQYDQNKINELITKGVEMLKIIEK